ncbi:WD40 repeat-like protein [Ascodesmis nigricans]|uniref:WD40 repeat-like protein n=1 Tax=Ascodesmis nigricans TaxID=341454 RepID=A0A4S2MW38_9PEZI|nr:WD40 repeat-like protein [Ascodesmis nigricans]
MPVGIGFIIYSEVTTQSATISSDDNEELYKLLNDVQENWDPLLQTLEGHSYAVFTLAFSPNGKTLASGSYDNTVRLWDPATGTSRRTVEGHWSGVTTLAFLPDRDILGNHQSSNGHLRPWGTSGNWITHEQHKMLFLPVDVQPTCRSIYSASVAWADALARVYIIELNSDWRPSSNSIYPVD